MQCVAYSKLHTALVWFIERKVDAFECTLTACCIAFSFIELYGVFLSKAYFHFPAQVY